MVTARIAAAAVWLAACGARAPAGKPEAGGERPGVTLTVPPASQSVNGLLREVRVVDVTPGGEVAWPGVSPEIDASDVTLIAADALPFTAGDATVDAPAADDALLTRAVGQAARLELVDGQVVHGTLLVLDEERAIVAEDAGGPVSIERGRIAAMTLSGISDKAAPPAVLRAPVGDDARGGRRLLALSYRVTMSWMAEVDAQVGADGRADLQAWATVQNGSGLSFAGAALRLSQGNGERELAAPPRRIDLQPNGVARVPLAARRGGAARRVLVYDPVGEDAVWTGQDVQLDRGYGLADNATVVNEQIELDGPPAALPAGTEVIVTASPGGAPIGRARLPAATPARAPLRVTVGPVAELTGSRRQVELTQEETRLVEELELSLANRGRSPRRVTVVERMARGDTWRISWTSAPMEKLDARSVRLVLDVPPGGQARARYRVIYSWPQD